MNTLFRIYLALLLAGSLAVAHAARALPRSAPEAQGVSSPALLELVDTLDREVDGMHGLMVLRHGHVIAEGWWKPYGPARNHVLYSLSKSFTSTAVGFAIAEGKLSLDDEVLKFFPEDAPTNASPNLKAMRVRDLLTMSTGHQEEPPVGPDAISARSFLAQEVPHLPGTHFKYNTPATFMQSVIVQKVSGQTVLDYLRPRLFGPLGIAHPVWDTNFQGISLGGYGLRVRTEDIARFGQLYLQQGRWDGKVLLPAEWVTMATAKQTSNGSNPKSDWNQGYGFQFWRCRHNTWRGDGAFGQYCLVMPDQDAVVAITAGVKDMQAVLNILWERLLPAMQRRALRKNAAASRELMERLARLEVRPAQGSATTAIAATNLNRRFVFPANEQKLEHITLSTSDSSKTLTLTMKRDGREIVIPCGYREWKNGRAPFSARLAEFPDEPIAATYAWPADNICVIKLCACETPYHTSFALKFEGRQLTLDSETNVAFGATKRPQLTGRAE